MVTHISEALPLYVWLMSRSTWWNKWVDLVTVLRGVLRHFHLERLEIWQKLKAWQKAKKKSRYEKKMLTSSYFERNISSNSATCWRSLVSATTFTLKWNTFCGVSRELCQKWEEQLRSVGICWRDSEFPKNKGVCENSKAPRHEKSWPI